MVIKQVSYVAAALVSVAALGAQAETLVLYTSQPNADAQATVDMFSKANPDIKVEWVRDGTTQLMARLEAELSAGAVKPDVLLIADSVTMESLKQRQLLQPYLSPERKAYDAALYDAQGHYYGTKLITTGIAHHSQASVQPKSWQDLLDPQLKGQVSMPSPLYSGAALIHLASLTNTPGLGWDYYEKLKANDVSAQGGNGAVLKAIASGTKPYGMLVDYMAIREKAKGAPIEFVFPQEGVSIVTEPVAILKSAAHPEAARRFVDFVLSQPGQELVREQGYVPALASVPVPEGFPARSEIKLLPFDAGQALRDAENNKQRFGELFGTK
ncbi:ABC transporter substrate-binding protein [Kerstersia similis]|uniref:ABC transporter substrate-binding protein n=1 Tax=Kerstersia similis TaxID=206505 RepID=UPI0039EFD83D